jgi:ABC-type nickel/cobalt efflux system permease component RcnA
MTAGLVVTALALGIRHGVDWDHIAAIADLSGTAETRRRGLVLSLLYALGHAAVVLMLGGAAILLGTQIPDALDDWMGRIVGVTLVLLGTWVLVGLLRHRRDFRLRSRWILIIDGTFAGLRRVRNTRSSRSVTVVHDHAHDEAADVPHTAAYAHDHAHVSTGADIPREVPAGRVTADAPQPDSRAGHRHAHRHELVLPGTETARYGSGTATGIGMLHGVGVESPTQIAVFVASTSVVGAWGGMVLLLAWVVGLVLANSVLAVMAGVGLLHADRNFAIYATLAVVVAAMSIVMGTAFIIGIDAFPAISL